VRKHHFTKGEALFLYPLFPIPTPTEILHYPAGGESGSPDIKAFFMFKLSYNHKNIDTRYPR
jgi:hypothetical protein